MRPEAHAGDEAPGAWRNGLRGRPGSMTAAAPPHHLAATAGRQGLGSAARLMAGPVRALKTLRWRVDRVTVP